MKSLVVVLLMGVSYWLGIASNVGAKKSEAPRFVTEVAVQPASYCSPFYRSLPCKEQMRVCQARERLGKVGM